MKLGTSAIAVIALLCAMPALAADNQPKPSNAPAATATRPSGQAAREAAEEARRQCHFSNCEKVKADKNAYEACMIECNQQFKVPPRKR